MKIVAEFSWYLNKKTNDIEPSVYTKVEKNYMDYLKKVMNFFFKKNEINKINKIEYKGLIANLLLDYAGNNYKNRVSISKKQLEKAEVNIRKIINRKKNEYYFGPGESWGAEIKKEGVLIYFVFQDDYFDIMPINCFYEILVNWRKFLETVPDLNNKVVIECTGD